MKVAIVVGHTSVSPGAVNAYTGISEFGFNEPVADYIGDTINTRWHPIPFEAEIVYRDLPNDYRGLPAKVNAVEPDFIISLHANAFTPQTSGTEMLYWHSSVKGQILARILQERIVQALGLPDRGIKPCRKHNRGAHLLRHTIAPCVICEPFFISNTEDLRIAHKNDAITLKRAYVLACLDYVNQQIDSSTLV